MRCDGLGSSILNPYDRPGTTPPIMLIGGRTIFPSCLPSIENFGFVPAHAHNQSCTSHVSAGPTTLLYTAYVPPSTYYHTVEVAWHIHDRAAPSTDSGTPTVLPRAPYDIAIVRRSTFAAAMRARVAYSAEFFPSCTLPTLTDTHLMTAIRLWIY